MGNLDEQQNESGDRLIKSAGIIDHKLSRREILASIGSAVMLASCAPGFVASRSTQTAIHYQSLATVSARIQAGELSPVDLTEQILGRIGRLDGTLHSYITTLPEQARSAAQRAEQEIRSGNYRGPLHGVPIAVKDLCFTAGVPTTGGHAFLSDFRPDFDATVVRKLKDAGAVILGKLNLTEGAMIGYHPDFSIPVNPWNVALSTSGSSSGSGVATAAGLCYASLGTDTGGSIRFPSMTCGVVGLKPTYGRVSRYGVLTLAESLDHVGPMVRRVEDAAIMFEVLAGRDVNDPTTLTEPVPDMQQTLTEGVVGIRIGYDRAYADNGVDPQLVATIENALGMLVDLGAEIVQIAMPEFTVDLARDWVTICSAEAARAHQRYYPSRANEYGAFFADFLAYGSAVSDRQYAQARRARDEFSARFVAALNQVDAVACPAGGVPSPAASDVGFGTVALQEVIGTTWVKYTYPADFAGTPTLTLPCGETALGFPYSMQIMGSRLSEPLLCRIGHSYENATSWHLRNPPV
ncbi:MAG: amidase [Proteobacteria bacterium]|nr:amidase [Pseudomonadota bacterium]